MPFRKKILIVEDNDLNRELLGNILAEHYRVLKAENGQVALDILKEQKDSISLILLDVHMPIMDGYTFLNRVKKDAELSAVPVIVMTQSNSEEDELEALEHGATDFLPKPYRAKIILHRVSALINLRETSAVVNQIRYDRLTGLYTKEFFYQQVKQRLREDPEEEYCIVCSNVENFKIINDTFGTGEGDRLLREVADITKRMVGDTGFCGRFSADRFLYFQKRGQKPLTPQNFADVEGIEASPMLKSVVIRWGIYEIEDRTISVEKMCDRAVLAVDSIKNQYDQYFAVYDDSLRSKLLREQAITSAMESALKEGQFVVYLQPKYSLTENCMAGAETLVRWIHPEWGFMSPGEFIPLFEKNGFIPKLDQYVWEQVCIQLREWKKKGYPILPVSVNISRADVYRGDLAETIFALTQKYEIEPSWLHLEITESAYAENPKIVCTVAELRRRGFVIEMDDFGSGYSSLNMLSQMSLDIVKLDMKFIQNELAKPVSQSFLGNVISMAHQTHLRVVAEGVETREQMNRLRAVGCDYVQGYFFAKPMPVPEYEELLKKWQPPEEYPQPQEWWDIEQRNSLLVVDEDDEYRKKVRKTFETQYRVLEAKDAKKALAWLKSSEGPSISAVILSTALPDNSFSRVFNTLRQTPSLWKIPVLVIISCSECGLEMPIAMEADDFLCRSHPLFDLHRRVQRLIEAASFRKWEVVLRNTASRDPLTGLLNRRGFQEAASSIRETDMPLAVCVFDLGNMKKINDTSGYETGDRMLQCFADQLCCKTRVEDIRCRYDEDKFLVVLKRISDPETAMNKAEMICRGFRKDEAGSDYSMVCSGGIALCGFGEKLSDEVIERANQALSRAKQENKGGCCLWAET